MAQYENCAGIGAALVISTEGTRIGHLFDDLQAAGVNTVDPGDAHVTIVYPHETMFPVQSKPEETVLGRVRDGVGSLLSHRAVTDEVFGVGSYEVEALGYRKSKVGIFIANLDWFADVRGEIGDLFRAETGLHMSTSVKGRVFSPHLALGTKSRLPPVQGQNTKFSDARIPNRIHVTGFTVTEEKAVRKRQNGGGAPKNDTRYRNRPRGVV